MELLWPPPGGHRIEPAVSDPEGLRSAGLAFARLDSDPHRDRWMSEMTAFRPDRTPAEHRRDLARMAPALEEDDGFAGEHERRWWTNRYFFDLHPLVHGLPPDTFFRAEQDADAGRAPLAIRLAEIQSVEVEVAENGWVKVALQRHGVRPHFIPFWGVRFERHYKGNVFTYDDVRIIDHSVPGIAEAFAQRLRGSIARAKEAATTQQ